MPSKLGLICLVALLTACTGGDTDTGADTGGDTGQAPEQQLWLGSCDIYDVPSLEQGLADLQAADADLDAITGLGLHLARPHRFLGHAFSLNLVHDKETDSFDWSLPDHLLTSAGDAGVHLFITLQPYAHTGPPPGPGFIHPEVPDEAQVDWERFVGAAVERYDGDGIQDMPGLELPVYAWEIGNEPRCPLGHTECIDAYVDLVRTSAQAAHAAHAEAVVLVGGAVPLYAPDGEQVDYVLELYSRFFEQGGAEFTDAFGFHYLLGESQPPLSDYATEWAQLAGDLPLWLTETGPYNANGIPVSEDPDQAATWLHDHLVEAWDLGLSQALWCKAGNDWGTHPAVEQVISDLDASLDQGAP